jgi:hypothetical protein
MKRLLAALLVLAIASTFVNDLGRWVTASYNLDNHIREVADNASAAARLDQARGWPAASETARRYGIEVTGYSQKNAEVIVTARVPVTGTWVVGPGLALLAKQPMSTPLHVEARTRSFFH